MVVRTRFLPSALASAVLLAACAGAADSPSAHDAPSDETPVSVENCGRGVSFDEPPTRIVALNSSAVENLLALGLGDRIVAADGEESGIKPDLREEFDDLNVIDSSGDSYPSAEAMLEHEPEFVYSVYPSAFRENDGIMTREDLAALDIESYLSPGRCPDRETTQKLRFEDFWAELTELGDLLGVPERAEQVVAEQRAALEEARASIPETDEPLTVFWWDMGTDQLTAGACCGGPDMVMDALGLDNIFSHVEGAWADVSWEAVIDRDPDLIVMADTSESWQEKREYLAGDTTLSQLRAFKDDRIVELPFSQTTPGLQSIDGIRSISEALSTWDSAQ
ncbi:hypothetical protein D9V41_07365 [Aeromicrobium phragmitis]|uniref:Fe/B12 periplasmic-binding domain-containing protein n=1 Tax=Aeromicrobium phragmitis TaxID=2478914 RepID=A0A3L8PNH4_9ACTN|nr:ABC transporter substrate-binding protein [Aeromicrobium phragmitis]RLV56243.1 hypothetical protein D9V41_07365 [Aeromicrobium phragmitis]